MEKLVPPEILWEEKAGEILELLLKVAPTSEKDKKRTSPGSSLSPPARYDSGAVASKDEISEAEIDSADTADWGLTVLRKMTRFTVADLVSAVVEARGPVAEAQLSTMFEHFWHEHEITDLDNAWKDCVFAVLEAGNLIKIHEPFRRAPEIKAEDLDEEDADKVYENVPKPKEGSTPEEIASFRLKKLTFAADFMNIGNQVRLVRSGMKMMILLETAKRHLIAQLEKSQSPC